jgi:hypothetical protein
MTPSARPLYTVQLDIGGVAWEARVNDAPLFAEMQGLRTGTELPLNRWIRNGANRFSYRLRPRPGQDGIPGNTRLSAVLYVRDWEADRQSRREVARVEYPGPTSVRDGETILETAFQAQVPYPPFLWFASDTIAGGETTRLDLAREYGRFYEWAASRNLEAVVRAMAVRDREDARANYASLGTQVANTRQTYGSLFNGGYELRPDRTDAAHLRIYGEGRLARLELSNGKPPLYYRASISMVAYLPLLFCRYRGAWTIIR